MKNEELFKDFMDGTRLILLMIRSKDGGKGNPDRTAKKKLSRNKAINNMVPFTDSWLSYRRLPSPQTERREQKSPWDNEYKRLLIGYYRIVYPEFFDCRDCGWGGMDIDALLKKMKETYGN